MSVRKHDDRVKPGKGIDGTEGEDYSRKHAKDPWGYGGSSAGSERSYGGEYSPNSDGASAQRGADDFQFTAETRQIWEDVEANQDEVSYGHNAITHGVNRKQDK